MEENGPEKALALLCERKHFEQPTYICFRIPKTQKIQCRVTVNYVIYSTYPSEYDSEADARTEAARIAFETIKENEIPEKYPVCMDSWIQLAWKILECISENGIFETKIPGLFQ